MDNNNPYHAIAKLFVPLFGKYGSRKQYGTVRVQIALHPKPWSPQDFQPIMINLPCARKRLRVCLCGFNRNDIALYDVQKIQNMKNMFVCTFESTLSCEKRLSSDYKRPNATAKHPQTKSKYRRGILARWLRHYDLFVFSHRVKRYWANQFEAMATNAGKRYYFYSVQQHHCFVSWLLQQRTISIMTTRLLPKQNIIRLAYMPTLTKWCYKITAIWQRHPVARRTNSIIKTHCLEEFGWKQNHWQKYDIVLTPVPFKQDEYVPNAIVVNKTPEENAKRLQERLIFLSTDKYGVHPVMQAILGDVKSMTPMKLTRNLTAVMKKVMVQLCRDNTYSDNNTDLIKSVRIDDTMSQGSINVNLQYISNALLYNKKINQ